MSRIGHEPLIYSNEHENIKQAYFLTGLFAFLSVGFVIFGIYLGVINGDWWVLLFLMPIAIIIGIISYAFYPSKRETIYKITLKEDGLHQLWHNTLTDEKIEKVISFQDVTQVLVGMVSDQISIHRGQEFYRYHALLIIMHNDEYFSQEILSSKELYEWIKRLHDKVPQISYTDLDLRDAFSSRAHKQIDFSKVPSYPENIISNHIGKETHDRFLKMWQPDK